MTKRMSSKNIIWTILFILVLIVWLYPILFALTTSFRPLQDIYNNVLKILPIPFTLENYATLTDRLPLVRIIMNTFTVALSVTVLKLVTSFLAAYGFVFTKFRGKQPVYFMFISTIFVPFTVTMIPIYLMLARVGLNDNVLGVILAQVADATGIILFFNSMKSIPAALFESAELDGANDWRIIKDMILPLIQPQLASTGIWFFVNSWNEFVWPSIILNSVENYTLPLALQMFISAEGGTHFGVAMAISVVTMAIPLLLYLIFQKYIIGTFTSAGIK